MTKTIKFTALLLAILIGAGSLAPSAYADRVTPRAPEDIAETVRLPVRQPQPIRIPIQLPPKNSCEIRCDRIYNTCLNLTPVCNPIDQVLGVCPERINSLSSAWMFHCMNSYAECTANIPDPCPN